MAVLIESDDFSLAWMKLLYGILHNGAEVSPRNMETKELTNVTFHVKDGLSNILISDVRDLNYRFMIAEWLWTRGGMADVGSLERYNSIMRQFSDDGIYLAGAYGPRLKTQWKYVFENLQQPFSRQAIASIWTTSPWPSKDIPCTLTLQWLIRNECINCTVNMRSSDAWLGLPYDFFNFSQLTNVVSSSFGLPVGSMTMNLASSHLYKQHFDLAKKLLLKDKVYSIDSPQFTKEVRVPSDEDLQEILNNPKGDFTSLGFPWVKYADALSTNKQHALEVLSELCSKE
jgi:thymidylate synthase